MSEFGDAVQEKCKTFADRVIKLNDYLLEQAASSMYDVRGKKYEARKGSSAFSHQTSDPSQPSSFSHQTSDLSLPSSFSHQPSRVPVHLQSMAALANQLLRSGTSIGANNAEATNAVSRQDFRSKSYIALKEARESLYWIELLHRNSYIDDKQFCQRTTTLRLINSSSQCNLVTFQSLTLTLPLCNVISILLRKSHCAKVYVSSLNGMHRIMHPDAS